VSQWIWVPTCTQLREHHALHTVDHMLASMAGARIFSKLDCNASFHQIPLAPESARLTTFTSPFGHFCYVRLSFGISSASEVFQKRMCRLLEGLDGTMCLIDDILIFGKDQAEHDQRLEAVLQRLRDAHVTLNDKCEFSKQELKYVGHIISADGIRPDPEKIIIKMREPRDVTEVRCFLGMINQLAKFSSTLAELSAPLRELLHKDTLWTWDKPQQQAYDNLKKALTSAPILALYDPAKPT
jgi:hypothetical protein